MRLKQQQFVGSIKDKLGRTIVLERERWEHICEHEQLDGHELAVLRTAEIAQARKPGNYPGSEVLYSQLGPARWLAVVVEYHGLAGRVITAYPYNKEPQTAT